MKRHNNNPLPTDPRFQDLRGRRFDRLTVVSYAGPVPESGGWVHTWECLCNCGTRIEVRGRNIKSGNTRSCGCLQKEVAGSQNLTHGHASNYTTTPEYKTWLMIRERCHSPGSSGYHKYGARGIAVCDRWRNDFLAFLADMGKKPSRNHSIDRFPDNDGNYEPGNCRWATASEQAYNRRTARFLRIRGQTMHLKEAARFSPVSESAVLRRLQKGWSDEDAVFTPPMTAGCGNR